MPTRDINCDRMNKPQLMELVERLNLSKQRIERKLEKLTNQNKALKTELDAIHAQNTINKDSRKLKRSELEAKNIEYLERALSIFEDFLDRPFDPRDYRKFVRYLLKVYPMPDYIQAPRLTKEEKMLSPELLEEARELKKRTGWSESRLRKFFKDRTGVVPTSKKYS